MSIFYRLELASCPSLIFCTRGLGLFVKPKGEPPNPLHPFVHHIGGVCRQSLIARVGQSPYQVSLSAKFLPFNPLQRSST